jgi:hypothetical protein
MAIKKTATPKTETKSVVAIVEKTAKKAAAKKTEVKAVVAPVAKATKKATTKTEVKAVVKPVEKAAKKATAKTEVKAVAAPVEKTAKKETAKTVSATAKVTFTLPKAAVQTAQTVAVIGEFNNWDMFKGVPLKKQKDGSFSTTLELEAGKEYQYRFLINGEVWENAWDAPKYVATPFGTFNSVVLA